MKPYIRFLIVAGIVVAAAAAVWYGVHRSPATPAPGASASPSLSPLASASPIAIAYDTAPKDWKTYSSASMNFSVSYPPDWHSGTCGPQCVGWAPLTAASDSFVLGIIETTETVDALLTKAQPYLVAKQDVKLGALSWIKLTLRQPQTGAIVTSHFVARGTKLYEFGTATTDPAIVIIYGRMIASFKFLK